MEQSKIGERAQIRFKSIKKPIRFSGLHQWLNKKGLDGWELHDTVTSYRDKTRTYYFRNPRIK